MKIIALLPFKNEEWVLPQYINSIKRIADFIIAFDDGSTDGGRLLLEKAGAKIISHNYEKTSGWAEFQIREVLLSEGRKNGGTHFICLDADEIFSNNFYKSSRDIISSLKPGQSLWMDWVNLYGSFNQERVDGVYEKLNKSFIFCDDGNANFNYVFLGVSRTPTDPKNRMVINRNTGSVIHFHYLEVERSMMKRVWYMCSELINADRSALRINITYDTPVVDVRELTSDTNFEILPGFSCSYDFRSDWRFNEIINWFEVRGVEFFEPLDIWRNSEFLEIFLKKTGRNPSFQRIPRWLISINNLKNRIKNAI